MSAPETETVKLTKRRCRYCRAEYRAPRGERWHACRDCAPTFYDALAEPEPAEAPAGGFVPPDDGIPF